jgi:hypothetical protein
LLKVSGNCVFLYNNSDNYNLSEGVEIMGDVVKAGEEFINYINKVCKKKDDRNMDSSTISETDATTNSSTG